MGLGGLLTTVGILEIHIPMIIIGLAFISAGVYVVYWTIKQVPRIHIDHTKIRLVTLFDCKEIFWGDIKRIRFTGKGSFVANLNTPTECMTIFMRDGRKVQVFDQFYSNSPLLKQYVKRFHERERNSNSIILTETDINYQLIRLEKFKYVKGRKYSLSNFTLIVAIPLFIIFLKIEKPDNPALLMLFTGFLYLFLFLITAFSSNYIGISNKFLIVKNNYFPWIRKIYLLTEIKEIVFESPPKIPDCFRIITHSFSNKSFPARLLRDKDWKALSKLIKAEGVRVRNELL